MKLINIDTARRIIDSPRNKTQMLAMLEQTPTVDAVEVVRCEHCLAYDSFKNGIEGFCRKMGKVMCGSDFCSYAERRTDK